jgi:transposase
VEERNEESAILLKRRSDALKGDRIMGRPYSTDLRERVLRACENGEESQAVIARRFEISESAVGSWLRQLHKEGRREPKPHGRGFRSILDEDDGAVLRSLVKDRNDATLQEYAHAFMDKTGEEVSESSICRALKRHGLVIKKRPYGRASSRDRMSLPNGRPTAKTWPR